MLSFANREELVLVVQITLATIVLILGAGVMSAAPQDTDPIPGYLSQMSETNLRTVANCLPPCDCFLPIRPQIF